MGRREAGGVLARRGLLAGAAALAAGGLARLANSGRVEAAHDVDIPYSHQTVLHAGVINTTSSPTNIDASTTGPGLIVRRGGGTVTATNDAIMGVTTGADNAGVLGSNASGGAYGVRGSASGAGGTGVDGVGGQYGVYGKTLANSEYVGIESGVAGVASGGAASGVLGTTFSTSPNATGVFGVASSGTGNPTVGVWGRSSSASTGAIGTFGESANGSGVRGLSGNGNGVFGVSTNASGVYGFSNFSFGAAGVSNVGVGVYASSAGNWGLHASSPIFAGVFSGAVYVSGNFTVTNGAKSAAVKNKRGEHRRVYCQESPEAWFEDFGRAELKDGRAVIPLDPEFDELVKGDDYQVFLTAYGDLGTLYVADLRPHRFEVRSERGPSGAGSFGYRVVARRLDDVGRRLEKVEVPDFSTVKRPVTPPDAPTRADRPGR